MTVESGYVPPGGEPVPSALEPGALELGGTGPDGAPGLAGTGARSTPRSHPESAAGPGNTGPPDAAGPASPAGTAPAGGVRPSGGSGPDGGAGTRAEPAIQATTIVAVVAVAAVAAFVSYRHMRGVALEQGEDRLAATVIPFSVDGLIVAASMTMLRDRRAGRPRSWLSYTLLTLGACASLAANVMHAEPTLAARIIAGWPPLALLGSYELLMRQIHAGRGTAGGRRPADIAITVPAQRAEQPAARPA
ncbi:DUF2637 domain-containing protein, partial [Frankia sp. CiP1_Cm_nod2]|uniref:DUF2637 domain-containing protein n=1 Tax=Frankia sp. CiP1_Cm_nod2 TaxID=2897161 RepID=UPI002024EE95